MAALAAEGVTIHAPITEIPIQQDEVSVKDLSVLETACPTVESLAVEDSRRPEEFQIQDSEIPVSRRLQRMRQASCYLSLYIAGYNCGVTGTLLPTIERVYHLNYASVSLLFVSFCIGYFVTAFGAGNAVKRWGFGNVLLGSGVVMMCGIIINCSQLVSFPLMCFAFVLVGMGFSTQASKLQLYYCQITYSYPQLGMCNSYFATLPRPLLRMGALHGTYGFGAFTSPLIASTFISRDIRINLFYLTSLGLIVPSIIVSYLAFVHGAARYDKLPADPVIIVDASSTQRTESLKEVLSRVEVWILAIFLLFYVGAEESIGGWIVSFMLQVRHGSTEGSAWVASGFYLGIAIGRVSLPILNQLVGERKIVLIYIVVAGGLQAVSWTVKSFVATAVATALVGFAISTFYTAAIHTASKLLPRRMHTTSMTVISSVGQSGSAIFPFVIGVISNKKGIWTVQPSIVALLAGQFICWTLVPKVGRRFD
ncbi:MFS general substrate transporter [Phellopilus nigrolimitatus]|nr:MFS general substrate transporter [Phellopilus nigrolimitatus]